MVVAPDWLARVATGTDTGALVAATDWDRTPLGRPDRWPQALRTAVSTCLTSRFPMLVLWGPDLVQIYNDGYRPILGDKHPRAMGSAARDVWPEIWDEIGPALEFVLRTGQSTLTEDGVLFLDRHGFLEECYFTWSYSPLFDDDGGTVAGVLDTVWETTEQVIGNRRLACLSELSASLVGALDEPAVVARACDALTRHAADIASVRIVRVDEAWVPAPEEQVVAAAHCRLLLQPSPFRAFDDAYRSFFSLLGDIVGRALADVERRRFDRDIAITFQRAMLPPSTDVPSVAVRYQPAAGVVGGDWYDVFSLAGQLVLTVGDCVGHGMESAAAMGKVRSAAKVLLLDGYGPARAMAALDRLADVVPGVETTTMCCLVVDPVTGAGHHSSAGHPPPLVLRDGEVRWLDDGRSVPLGAPLRAPRPDAPVQLQRGDLVLLYTDGLVERREESIDDGLARLAETVRGLTTLDPEEVADRVLEVQLDGGARDDVALVVYRH